MKPVKRQIREVSHTDLFEVTGGECCRSWSKVCLPLGEDVCLAKLRKGAMVAPSLQRFTRYPGSHVSIEPLALPTTEWLLSPLKSYGVLFNHGDMALYWDVDVTAEDEDEMIEKIAQKIHEYDLSLIAILMIDTLKPLSFIGANMGRVFVSPFLPALGENTRNSGVKLLQIFENKDNIDKLLNAVEKLDKEEKQRKKTEKAKKLEGKSQETQKKWWKRIIP